MQCKGGCGINCKKDSPHPAECVRVHIHQQVAALHVSDSQADVTGRYLLVASLVPQICECDITKICVFLFVLAAAESGLGAEL